jgi:hypothetical protein
VSPFGSLLPPQPNVYPHPSLSCSSLPTTHHSLPTFLHPLFSYSYKPLGGQPLSFHIHTKPPGVYPRRSRSVSLCLPVRLKALTPFRINTCKSVTKQKTLSMCTINTYAKTGGGGPAPVRRCRGVASARRGRRPHLALVVAQHAAPTALRLGPGVRWSPSKLRTKR